jgi:hypothetical protein
MATPTRDEQEDAFAKRLYDIARAAGLAAREAANGLISVRFVGIDEVGIGSVDLCATSLDWKTLQHVALYLGARREGRSLFSLELQAEGGGYDALFSAEQFEEFMDSCTARLQAAAAEGFSKVRAYVGLLRCARSLSHFTLQINVTFRLKKLADAADASAAKNVDTGRKRLHYGTVRAPAACRVCRRSLIAFRRRTVGWTGRLGRQSA